MPGALNLPQLQKLLAQPVGSMAGKVIFLDEVSGNTLHAQLLYGGQVALHGFGALFGITLAHLSRDGRGIHQGEVKNFVPGVVKDGAYVV